MSFTPGTRIGQDDFDQLLVRNKKIDEFFVVELIQGEVDLAAVLRSALDEAL
jgi:hypothetical protein